jgi:hypothetical protein
MLRLAALSALVAMTGCVDTGDEGMIIRNVTAVSGDSCAFSGSPDQPFLAHGVVSSYSPVGYLFTPLIQSRVIADNDQQLQRTIQLRSANVRLVEKARSVNDGAPTQSEATRGEFSTLFAGALPPGGSVNVGFDLIPPHILRTLIPAATTDRVSVQLVATVTVVGDFTGDEITSTPFQFPVTVCNDCIVVDNGACPMTLGSPRAGNACNPYQDGIVDCCRDDANNLICPGSQ